MKLIITIFFTATLILGVSLIPETKTPLTKLGVNSPLVENQFQKKLKELHRGQLPINILGKGKFYLNFANNANAQSTVGDATCEAIINDTNEACLALGGPSGYQHGALKHFNQQLCKMNDENGADVENVFCHLRVSMGIEPDLTNLPFSEEVTFGSLTINVEVTAPTESFATTEGYIAKAVVKVSNGDNLDNATYLVLYWGFADNNDLANVDASKTKGFLIEGYNPNGLGDYRASYFKWDLTGTVQKGKYIAATFPSAESNTTLTSHTPENHYLNDNSGEGDRVYYGRFEINNKTKVTNIQGVMIEPQRGESPPGNFGCFKIYGIGTKGGQMVIAKSRDNHSDSFMQHGHTSDSDGDDSSGFTSDKSFEDMDAACVQDSFNTPDLKGNLAEGSGEDVREQAIVNVLKTGLINANLTTSSQVFDLSCEDLKVMGTTGGLASGYVFSNSHGTNWVSFSATPSEVFPTEVGTPSFPTSGLCDNVDSSDGTDRDSDCYCGTN